MYQHNHSLFHAVATYAACVAFPEFEALESIDNRSKERISELIELLVTPQGISIEQSLNYHFGIIGIFYDLYNALSSHPPSKNMVLKLENRIVRSVIFSLMIIRPDGTAAIFGDSSSMDDLGEQIKPYLTLPDLQTFDGSVLKLFQLGGGEYNKKSGLVLFKEDGYAVFRNDITSNEHPVHVFVDASPQVHSHGHFDATSFTYWRNGKEWLIDGGGPYQYDRAEYTYLKSSFPHNLSLISGIPQSHGQSVITSSRVDYSTWKLSSTTNVYGTLGNLTRDFTFHDNGDMRIVTSVDVDDGFKDSIVVRFVLNPNVKPAKSLNAKHIVALNWDGEEIFLDADKNVSEINVYKGKKGPIREWGIVSPSFGKLVETNIVEFVWEKGVNSPGVSIITKK